MMLYTKIAAIILLLTYLQQANGSKINCENLSTVDCKLRFGHTFDREFKSLHKETMRVILKRILEINEELLKELPSGLDAEDFKKDNEMLGKDLSALEGNNDSNEEVAAIIKRIMEHLAQFDGYKKNNEFQEFLEKKNLLEFVFECLTKLLEKSADMSTELYHDLRDEDRKEFPIYDKVYESMKALGSEADRPKQRTMFRDVFREINENFETPYIQVIMAQIPQ